MPNLYLYLMGFPRIELDGEPVKVNSHKAIALLVYLAVTAEGHSRDELTNLFWPEYDTARGRTNLRHTLYVLRKELSSDWVEADRESIRLYPDADLWLDVDEFHDLVAECQTHGHERSVCSEISPLLTNKRPRRSFSSELEA